MGCEYYKTEEMNVIYGSRVLRFDSNEFSVESFSAYSLGVVYLAWARPQ
jgi:hypothetical protein